MKVKIDGINYHVELCGEGFPLLLLHGFTGSTTTWTSFCQQWGGHSKLIIPDLIGHGLTGPADADIERFQIEAAAADMVELLDCLGLGKVDLLGYSMGGRLALTFALLYPERVRKLVLESASPGLLTEDERKLRRMKDAELANFIMDEGIEAFVNHWENIPLFSTMKRLPSSVQSEIREQRLQNSPHGLSRSLLGMGTGSQPSWWNRLGDLSCPVLLLCGELDTKFYLIAENMQKRLNDAMLVIVPNSGHAIHVEEREKFGTIISDFLNKGGVSFDS